MADMEETPAQRQARIRQAKREAKIKGTAQERLEKITKLSGRTPEMMRSESPLPTPPIASSPGAQPTFSTDAPDPPISVPNSGDPEQIRAQEEYLRALLRSPPGQQQQQSQQGGLGQPGMEEDPMLKMLQAMMGGMGGMGGDDPNAAGVGGLPSFSPDDISKATGLPSFVTNMIMGGAPKTPPTLAEVRTARLWKLLHVLFAVVIGTYLLSTVSRAVSVFGEQPPAPATARNPFVLFVTGELLVHGSRIALSSQPAKSGPGAWLQMVKDVGRDGAIVVFFLGVYSWWHGH